MGHDKCGINTQLVASHNSHLLHLFSAIEVVGHLDEHFGWHTAHSGARCAERAVIYNDIVIRFFGDFFARR